MAEYGINFITTASLYVTVEAESLTEAIEKAYDEMPTTSIAANPFDLGDWEDNLPGCTIDGEEIPDTELEN